MAETHHRILVATPQTVLRVDPESGAMEATTGLDGRRPSGLAGDPWVAGRAWCGTLGEGVFRSDDGGARWRRVGLPGERITSLAASPAREDEVWAGTEPSAVWRSGDGGESWERRRGLDALPSSSEWSFPPRPDTHHVRWIAGHPGEPGRLWVAIEAGALIRTSDGGRSWGDRVPGGPFDTHELAVHPDRPDVLRVAAGDGYYESHDGGDTWTAPRNGLRVAYLRSAAVDPGDPDVVMVSGSSGPHSAYVAGRSDGRLYRRVGDGPWRRVTEGWPNPPSTIAPLLLAGSAPGELWAADERGVHRSGDGGESWQMIARFDRTPNHLRGLAGMRTGDR
jgi:photosystem II stability/assembly factor-like uncharacterized protein